ncbi:hypothetical protein GCM10027019_30240 [Melaminivora jejuensis]
MQQRVREECGIGWPGRRAAGEGCKREALGQAGHTHRYNRRQYKPAPRNLRRALSSPTSPVPAPSSAPSA